MKVNTYGLLTFEQMKAHHEAIEAERERVAKAQQEVHAKYEAPKKSAAAKQTGSLSFAFDDEENGDEDDTPAAKKVPSRKERASEEGDDDATVKRKRFGKNPEVDTSFLPDRDREEAEHAEREKLLNEIKQVVSNGGAYSKDRSFPRDSAGSK